MRVHVDFNQLGATDDGTLLGEVEGREIGDPSQEVPVGTVIEVYDHDGYSALATVQSYRLSESGGRWYVVVHVEPSPGALSGHQISEEAEAQSRPRRSANH